MAGKFQASYITQITYYYKEKGYDSQQVPVVHGFWQGCVDEKSLPPLFPEGGATGEGGGQGLQMTCA